MDPPFGGPAVHFTPITTFYFSIFRSRFHDHYTSQPIASCQMACDLIAKVMSDSKGNSSLNETHYNTSILHHLCLTVSLAAILHLSSKLIVLV
jgi:hypothetical protein